MTNTVFTLLGCLLLFCLFCAVFTSIADAQECNETIKAVVPRQMNAYDKAWAGNYQDDNQDAFSIWRPRVRPGEFVISYVVSPDNNDEEPDFFTPVIERESNCSVGAMAEPTSFKCQWAANSDGNYAFWRPICPDGYVSMSDLVVDNQDCTEGDIVPNIAETAFRCIHESITEKVDLGKTVWRSKEIANEAEIKAVGSSNQGFRIFQLDGSNPGGFNPSDDVVQFRISNVPSPLYRQLVEVLTLSNPSTVEQKMSFTLQKGLQSSLSTEETISSEFRSDFTQKFAAGAEGIVTSETSLSFGFTFLSSSTISKTDITSTTQTTTIQITIPPLSTAKLAQLLVVDSPPESGTAATTLFTSNYALDIQPLNSTELPVSGSNNSFVSGSSCDAVSLDVQTILARHDAAENLLDRIAQAITTTTDAILTETDQIYHKQIETNVRLAEASSKIDSNENMLLNLQNNVETEKTMLNVILEILDDDSGGKKHGKKHSRVGNTRDEMMDNDY